MTHSTAEELRAYEEKCAHLNYLISVRGYPFQYARAYFDENGIINNYNNKNAIVKPRNLLDLRNAKTSLEFCILSDQKNDICAPPI